MSRIVQFWYKSTAGVPSLRTVTVDSIEILTKDRPEPGVFIVGYCHLRKARRSFDTRRIVPSNPHTNEVLLHVVQSKSAKLSGGDEEELFEVLHAPGKDLGKFL